VSLSIIGNFVSYNFIFLSRELKFLNVFFFFFSEILKGAQHPLPFSKWKGNFTAPLHSFFMVLSPMVLIPVYKNERISYMTTFNIKELQQFKEIVPFMQ